ncbi:MAG: nuclear transport factor 2 family protein [Gemmataceae bacterium]
MKKSLAALFALLTFIPAARADDAAADEVSAAIGKLNQAFEKGNAAALKQLMTADKVAVTGYYGGPVTRDEQIKSLADLKLSEYKPGKMTIKLLGKEAALVSYELGMRGTFKGKPLPARSYASAVWVKQAGLWREAFYQETALGAR